MKLQRFVRSENNRTYSPGLEIEFESRNSEQDSNFYSIIIGENGTGKTRILEDLVTSFRSGYGIDSPVDSLTGVKINFEDNCPPQKLIYSFFNVYKRKILDTGFNAGRDIYISDFKSYNIETQVAEMYLENFLQEKPQNETHIFEKSLDKLTNFLSLDQNPKMSMSGLSGIEYFRLYQLVKKADINSFKDLMAERSDLCQLDEKGFYENFYKN